MITLTSFQLKWLERLIILHHIIEDNNVQAKLSASQYGFRADVSTETALHEFVRRVEHWLVRKKLTLLQMPAEQIKQTKVFERNFERQIMDKKNAIRSESVLNQNTVKVYVDDSIPGLDPFIFFLILKFKFKFTDFKKNKFKFIDFEKTKFKFKFIDFEKSKFKFIDFAKVEIKFKFINNS